MSAKLIPLRNYLEEAPIEYLECRTFQHAWNSKKGSVKRSGRRIEWTLPCMRCGTHKTIFFGPCGRLDNMSPRYYHPDGYLIEGGVSKDDRAEMRIALFDLSPMTETE